MTVKSKHLDLGLIVVLAVLLAACATTAAPATTPTKAPAAAATTAAAATAAPAATQAPVASPTAATPQNPDIILATTTSTRDTGLLDVLLPDFEKRTGYKVKPIAVGSGQAMALGERGEADVLLVHAPASEKKFMQAGHGTQRLLVMHNDFVIVGPPSDPAGIKGMKKAADALKTISEKQSLFVSRGDNSGTHQLENQLWQAAGIKPAGSWYQSAGQGMGDVLAITSEKDGYTVSDRGTYLALKKRINLEVMVEGDPALLNIYSVITVNPNKNDRINAEGAKAFAAYLVSSEAQAIIKTYGVDKYGEPLFVPDAGKKEEELAAG